MTVAGVWRPLCVVVLQMKWKAAHYCLLPHECSRVLSPRCLMLNSMSSRLTTGSGSGESTEAGGRHRGGCGRDCRRYSGAAVSASSRVQLPIGFAVSVQLRRLAWCGGRRTIITGLRSHQWCCSGHAVSCRCTLFLICNWALQTAVTGRHTNEG